MSASTDATNDSPAQPSLADRMRRVRAGTRQDLEVTRHLFRGEPAYVIRDPVTFQSHRFEPGDYQIFVALDRSHDLGEVFERLVSSGLMDQKDEESFYKFVFQLHQLSFLNLPISDEKRLYDRHVLKSAAKRRQKLTGIMFLQVPLVNPNDFLERTQAYVRFVFSKSFFLLWLILIAVAGLTVVKNFDDLIEPVQGILMAQNLPLMWLTLIVLKLFHEFGHAYACKRFGGYVPEMGLFLIVFTPCAYVDATACWGFSRTRDRVIVCLAGMYIESIFAAVAVLVWAMTAPGLLHSTAYNVIFLAGVVTVLFNINPLMRFDGYYVFSDLVEVPNLRARASRYVAHVGKRVLLSIESTAQVMNRRMRTLLFSFGVASIIYRFIIIVGIASVVAMKIPVIGLGVATLMLGATVIGLVRRLTKYMWFSEETAPVRARAVALSLLLLLGVPAVFGLVPLPANVQAQGVLEQIDQAIVRAEVDGFIQQIGIGPGQDVEPKQILLKLDHDVYREGLAGAQAALDASEIRLIAYQTMDPASAAQEDSQREALHKNLELQQRNIDSLICRSPTAGEVTTCLEPSRVGGFIRRGMPIATISSGQWTIKALLSEEDYADADPVIGDVVEVRCAAALDQDMAASVLEVAPVGSRFVEGLALTHAGGGQIAVDPMTGEAEQAYFDVTIVVDLDDASTIMHGATCQVRFEAGTDTLGTKIARRILRFANVLAQ